MIKIFVQQKQDKSSYKLHGLQNQSNLNYYKDDYEETVNEIIKNIINENNVDNISNIYGIYTKDTNTKENIIVPIMLSNINGIIYLPEDLNQLPKY